MTTQPHHTAIKGNQEDLRRLAAELTKIADLLRQYGPLAG